MTGRHIAMALALLVALPGAARAQQAPPKGKGKGQRRGFGAIFGDPDLPKDVIIGLPEKGLGGTSFRIRENWIVAAANGGVEFVAQDMRIACDRAVFWLPRDPNISSNFPIQAIYAEGHVSATDGRSGIEAERAYFDLINSRALIDNARVRLEPEAKLRAQGGALAQKVFIRARRMSIDGAAQMLAEDVQLTYCDFDDPHFRIIASTLTLSSETVRYPGAIATLGGPGVTGLNVGGEGSILASMFRPDKKTKKRMRRKKKKKGLAPKDPNQASDKPSDSIEAKESKGGGDQDEDKEDLLGPTAPEDGQPIREGSDRLTGFRDTPRWIELRDARLEVGALPILYLPYLPWNSAWTNPPRVRFGSSRQFGSFFGIEWTVPVLEAYKVRGPGGKPVRQGVAANLSGGIQRSSKRGISQSFGSKLKFYNMGRRLGSARIEGEYLKDEGRDDVTNFDKTDRFWYRYASKLEPIEKLRLDSEFSYLSDRGYLLEFQERTAKVEKQQETYGYIHNRYENSLATALARFRINRFQTYVERLPELTYDLFSEPVLDDPLGGQSTFSWSAAAALINIKRDNRLNIPDQRIARVDSQAELDEKIPVGPLILRGFARQRFSAFSNAPGRDDGTERLTSEGGVNLNTTLSRTFLGKYTHVIVPEVGYFNRFFNTRDPDELFTIDEVERVQETEFLFLRGRTRLSVLDPAGTTYYDLIDLAIEGRYFPKSGSDNRRDNFGLIFGDLRLYLPSILSARLRADIDPARGQVLNADATTSITIKKGLRVGLSYRDLRDVSEAVGWNISWQISERYNLRLEEQYDFRTGDFTVHRATFRRVLHQIAVDLSVSIDPGEDDVSFSVSVVPTFLGGDLDPFRSGNLSGTGF